MGGYQKQKKKKIYSLSRPEELVVKSKQKASIIEILVRK